MTKMSKHGSPYTPGKAYEIAGKFYVAGKGGNLITAPRPGDGKQIGDRVFFWKNKKLMYRKLQEKGKDNG